jgi:hypothetical protein
MSIPIKAVFACPFSTLAATFASNELRRDEVAELDGVLVPEVLHCLIASASAEEGLVLCTDLTALLTLELATLFGFCSFFRRSSTIFDRVVLFALVFDDVSAEVLFVLELELALLVVFALALPFGIEVGSVCFSGVGFEGGSKSSSELESLVELISILFAVDL